MINGVIEPPVAVQSGVDQLLHAAGHIELVFHHLIIEFQRVDLFPDRIRHAVEGVAELANLIAALHLRPRVQVAPADRQALAVKGLDGADEHPVENDGEDDMEQRDATEYDQDEDVKLVKPVFELLDLNLEEHDRIAQEGELMRNIK